MKPIDLPAVHQEFGTLTWSGPGIELLRRLELVDALYHYLGSFSGFVERVTVGRFDAMVVHTFVQKKL